jgi:hypothetical protein
LKQQYSLAFRTSKKENFPQFYSNAWRWAWGLLKPEVNPIDIEQATVSLIKMLIDQVVANNGFTGIPMFKLSPTFESHTDNRAVMGFVGKNIEAANFLLQNSDE